MRYLALLTLLPSLALAGRGSSNAAIAQAIASNETDAIVSELERAEFLACVSCIDTVAPLVDHQSPKVREAAAWWLARRGVRDDVRDMALARLKGNDPTLALHGAELLGTFRHVEAVPALSAYLAAPLDAQSAAAAATALGNIGHPSGVPALQQALASPQPAVRAASAQALREIRYNGSTPANAVPLLALLSDPVEAVRTQAVYTLAWMGDRAATAPIAAVLGGDASPTVRKHAAWALGQLADPAGVPALTRAKSDSDPLVCSVASAALARLR